MDTENNKIFLNSDFENALISYLDAKGLDVKSKKKYLEFFNKFRNVQGELNQENVDEFLKHNNSSPARAMMQHLLRSIKRWDFPKEIKGSCAMLDIPSRTGKKEKKKPLMMSFVELERLIENMKGNSITEERNRLCILTQWWGGLRVSEVLGISIEDLGLDNFKEKEWQSIRIRPETAKFGKERKAYIPLWLYKKITKYLSQRMTLSRNFNNKAGEGENIWGFGFTAYRKMLGKRTKNILGRSFNTHSLRHGRATDLINKGVKIEEVKEILGHADISSTQTYVHLSEEDIENSLR